LPLVETAPLKAPQPRRELSWAPGAEGETRLGLLFARRAPSRPACRSGLSEHEFSEPEKLVGQKATPGGGHDHREAKADQQQSVRHTRTWWYRLCGCHAHFPRALFTSPANTPGALEAEEDVMQRHYLNNRRIQGAAEAAPLHSAIRQQTLGSLGTRRRSWR
jgi:hypothetical protein